MSGNAQYALRQRSPQWQGNPRPRTNAAGSGTRVPPHWEPPPLRLSDPAASDVVANNPSKPQDQPHISAVK